MSVALLTLNTDRTDAVTTKSVAATKCRPGHIRLPAPNASVITGSSRNVPSSLRKRSGLNASGSGYSSGSCRTALSHFIKNADGQMTVNAPCVRYNHRTYQEHRFRLRQPGNWRSFQTFWDEMAPIDIVVTCRVGKALRKRSTG